MIDCHFMAHFFFMKCECVVTTHCARIELSLYLSVGLIGLLLMTTTTTTMVTIGIATMGLVAVVTVTVTMAMVAGVVGMVGKLVVAVSEVVVAVAAIMRPADAFFVPVVRSLVPVHLERCSLQATHSQILPHSKSFAEQPNWKAAVREGTTWEGNADENAAKWRKLNRIEA